MSGQLQVKKKRGDPKYWNIGMGQRFYAQEEQENEGEESDDSDYSSDTDEDKQWGNDIDGEEWD